MVREAFLSVFGAGYLDGVLRMTHSWLVLHLISAWSTDAASEGSWEGAALIICLWFVISAVRSSVLEWPGKV